MAVVYDHSLDNSVVKWTDILILGVLGLFAIALAPQIINRVRDRSEWWKGLILYRSKSSATRDDSSSITARNSRDQPSVVELKSPRKPVPHTKSLTSRLPLAAKLLRLPTPFAGYTTGKAAILLFYFGVLLFAALYKGSIWKDSVREGAIVASQLPWVYILATKNNAIGALLGRGYEKLNYLHRWVGLLVVVAGNVHAIGFIYKWTMKGTWVEDTKEQYVRWGLVALVALDILVIFSLGFVRRHYYNLFYVSHSIALVVLLIAISKHQAFAIPYVAIAAGFYGADHVLRLAKSRLPLATLEAQPDIHSTLVRVPALAGGWRAGQYVRVRVLSRAMGAYAWLEPHTFTIASAPESACGDGMLLLVKRCGNWTRSLYTLAQEGADAPGAGARRKVRLLVEGPYGGPGFTNFSSFSGALVFCGGSGISYGMAVIQELLQRATQGQSNICAVELVWCATHARALVPLLECFTALLAQAAAPRVALTVQVFYTRALAPEDAAALAKVPAGLALAAGRPFVAQLLDAFVARTRDALGGARAHGVLLSTCGPLSLAGDARAAIAALDKDDRREVGGVEFHDEAFHW